MDRLDAMSVFTRIVEARSFTKVASDLGVPRSTLTDAIKNLEARLGVSLLHRTTRVVRPTLDGDAYYHRCLSILSEVEDAESAFSGARPKGVLRVHVHVGLPAISCFRPFRISCHVFPTSKSGSEKATGWSIWCAKVWIVCCV